jgi:hypothetical protein
MMMKAGLLLAALVSPFFLMTGATALAARGWRGSVFTRGTVVRKLEFPKVLYTFTPEGGKPLQDVASLAISRQRWDEIGPGYHVSIEYVPGDPGRHQYARSSRGQTDGSGRFWISVSIAALTGLLALVGLLVAVTGLVSGLRRGAAAATT